MREQPRTPRAAQPAAKDADTAALEKRLTDALGLKVTIDHRASTAADIAYRDLDQLEEIVKRLDAARSRQVAVEHDVIAWFNRGIQ